MPKKLVIIGDLHGDYDKTVFCLINHQIIDNKLNWIANDTYIIQLGDQLDSYIRTEDSTVETDWEKVPDFKILILMNDLDIKARVFGGRVISLIGNHELMNILGNFSYVSPNSMFHSGGVEKRKEIFSRNPSSILKNRPAVVKIGDIIFVHAGIMSHHLTVIEDFLKLKELDDNSNTLISFINGLFQKWLSGEDINDSRANIFNQLFLSDLGIIWTRKYIETPGSLLDFSLTFVLNSLKANRIIVGHTVVDNITRVANDKLWFVDTGLSRAFGNRKTQFLEVIVK
jgi:hypothetical protein